MTGIDRDQRHVDVTGERTSAFRADFSNEQDAAATVGAKGQLFGVEGSALLVVKRGPNAGSRFLLDHATTTAGHHPNSDIFLDDVTVSRQHAQFRCDPYALPALASPATIDAEPATPKAKFTDGANAPAALFATT
jgi:hypothetical protein